MKTVKTDKSKQEDLKKIEKIFKKFSWRYLLKRGLICPDRWLVLNLKK
jgi:hypothetical protein